MRKSKFVMKIVAGLGIALVSAALLGPARAAEKPLSSDDVLLMLLAGASTDKMLALIEQRGIDFRMNPDLAQKFHNAGADDLVIEALQKASVKPPPVPQGAGNSAPPATPAPPTISHQAKPSQSPQDEERRLAPAFSLVDLSGQRLALEDMKGQVVVLNFWATWCPRCRAAIPHLVELQDMYRKQGLRVVGLSIDGGPKAVKNFFQMQVVNYPVAMADLKVRNSYGGISGIPTTFLIGRDGRIYFKRIGAPDGPGLSSYLEPEIKMLLSLGPDGEPAQPGDARSTVAATSSNVATPVSEDQSATESESAPAAAPAQPAPSSSPSAAKPKVKLPPLADPSTEEIQKIIQEFAAKEKIFKQARNNYTYHQLNKLSELNEGGEVVGIFQQEWDILFNDDGTRVERVTYAPPDTLKRIGVTKEDLDNMRSIQPFVLTTDELAEYDVKYLGHVRVDEITAYVFDVRPKEIKKNRLYFQGRVWVDDRDLQIVKSEGKTVPEMKTKKGENLFPRFTTYREQIDGKFWFPTYTIANDTLYFATGPVAIKQMIRYTDYKQFKSKVRILSTEAADAPETPAPGTPTPKK